MKTLRLLVVFGALGLTAIATQQAASTKAAVVNGETITEAQVALAAAADLRKLAANPRKTQEALAHERLSLMWKALDQMIANKVLNLEAKAAGKTKEELVQSEVDSDLPLTPPENVVEAYYDGNKERFSGPRPAAIERVRKFLVERTRRNAYNSYVWSLRKQYRVETFMEPLRVKVATAGYPSRGPLAAPVTIVEFSDFECPYCNALLPAMKMIEKNYGAKVRFVFRQYPMPWFHPHAPKAAEASLCANQQGRFWDFHDSLFANQKDLTVEALKRRTTDLKLDTAAFNACLDSGQQANAVRKDVEEGNRIGVGGTPTVFINGRMIYGTQAYADLKQVIDDEIRRREPR